MPKVRPKAVQPEAVQPKAVVLKATSKAVQPKAVQPKDRVETESWNAVLGMYGDIDPNEFMASVASLAMLKAMLKAMPKAVQPKQPKALPGKPKDRLLAAMLEASRESGSSDSNGCCSRSNT